MDGLRQRASGGPIISSRQSRVTHSPYHNAAIQRRSILSSIASAASASPANPHVVNLDASASTEPQPYECVQYSRYKTEKTVFEESCGRIVMIGSGSSKHELKKLLEILNVVNYHLSAPDITIEQLQRCKSFLYLGGARRILGCVVAEPVDFAYRVIPSKTRDDNPAVVCCTTEKVPAVCGISRVWVQKLHRKRCIATKLLDAARNNFVYGSSLDKQVLAFSQPTGDGKFLAMRYTRTRSFLVYPEEAVTNKTLPLE